MLKKFNIFRRRRGKSVQSKEDISRIFRGKYSWFKELLASNTEALNIIKDMEEKLQGRHISGMSYLREKSTRAVFHTFRMFKCLNNLSNNKYVSLYDILEKTNGKIKKALEKRKEISLTNWILPYSKVTKEMVDWVGGKNANLGEVYNRVKLPIPDGFAITTRAFVSFIDHNDLVDEITKLKIELDADVPEKINRVSREIQKLITSAQIPNELEEAILLAYGRMADATTQRGSAGSSP